MIRNRFVEPGYFPLLLLVFKIFWSLVNSLHFIDNVV